MAADRPACARLLAVASAGRSAASYTITRDTTYCFTARRQIRAEPTVDRMAEKPRFIETNESAISPPATRNSSKAATASAR